MVVMYLKYLPESKQKKRKLGNGMPAVTITNSLDTPTCIVQTIVSEIIDIIYIMLISKKEQYSPLSN